MDNTRVVVTKEKLDIIAKDCVLTQMLADSLNSIFSEIDSITTLVAAKNADYGDAWQRFDIFTPLVRINDKLLRVINLSDGRPALVADENIKDTLRDTVGYALLALLKIKHMEDLHNTKLQDTTVEEEMLKHLPDVDETIDEK